MCSAGPVAGATTRSTLSTQSDKIQGLTYFDFAATQEHWDSDPEWDGLQITMSYYNEFGDPLSFHDKSHKITIEIYSEVEGATPPDPCRVAPSSPRRPSNYSNSDDLINIPIEYYGGSLALPSTEAITGCLSCAFSRRRRYPQKELYYSTCGVELYTPEMRSIL